MSQHDYNIANQGFPNFRSDLNNALGAIATNNSGSTAPTTTFAHQWWLDTSTTPNTLRIRNADNDAWVVVGTVNQTDDTFVFTPAAGSASAPAYSVTGDTNTGIFFPAADTIAFAEGGAEAMRIDSSGNVGIGTNSPTQRLDVVAANSQIHFGAATTGGGYLMSTANGQFRISGGAVYDGSNWIAKSTTASIIGDDATGDIKFLSNTSLTAGNSFTPTERMRIDSSGNVGIGTSTPLLTAANRTNLTVNGTTDSIVVVSSGGTARGWLYGVSGTTVLAAGTSSSLNFEANGAERARITSGGYFKASNSGSYNASTGSYHELRNNAQSEHAVVLENSNTSFDQNGGGAVAIGVTRSASSSYTFIGAYSGGFADREFQLRGDGNGYADGTWNNNGADYAEFFESANGQALTLGATVVLDGNKVREATSQDPASAIIGVVRPKEPSKASMVVGNTAWNKWANKYLTDDFDRYIMEDHDVVEWEETITDEEGKTSTKQHSYESHNIPAGVTVPADAVRKTHDDKGNKFQHYKLNPAWDKDAEYVNRENRPEWNIIGLLGQVKILKGQPVGDRWIKMRDVSSSVEEWMIR